MIKVKDIENRIDEVERHLDRYIQYKEDTDDMEQRKYYQGHIQSKESELDNLKLWLAVYFD